MFCGLIFLTCVKRGLNQLQHIHHSVNADENDNKTRAYPLMIQGLKTNPNDPECHILCFDIEALVGKLSNINIYMCICRILRAIFIITLFKLHKFIYIDKYVYICFSSIVNYKIMM